jgi:hypothetical protein
MVHVVMGVLITSGINNLNQNRLEIDQQEVIAKTVLKQMKRDLQEIEDQLTYMEGQEEVYDLFLTERILNENEKNKKLLHESFL